MANQVYTYVTERIIKALDKGTIPWRKPWSGADGPMNFITKKPYRGINQVLLSISEFSSPYWLTAKQLFDKGGSLKPNQEYSIIVFFKVSKFTNPADTEDTKTIPFLRYYRVYNTEQCDGLVLPVVEASKFTSIETCEEIVNEMPNPPRVEFGGGRACYFPSLDKIRMPKAETFSPPEEYYSTYFHEMVHSTGDRKRLKRFAETESDHVFGSNSYSKEELVAEIGAAFLCAVGGIENVTLENSASYIDGWRKRISEDKTLIVKAANQAQKAADYILNKKPYEEKESV
jgi:antirestriction protein ArdC